jgi:hypothetical protein
LSIRPLARDGLKNVIPLNEKKVLLAELVLHFYVEGLNEIANADLDAWLTLAIEAEPALRKLQWGAGAENALPRFELFLQDLRNATLLVRPGEKDFRFGHTSVREFFLAEALHRHIREGRLETLSGPAMTDETINFLIARQRNGVSDRDARRFREQFPRLLDPGRDMELRWVAAKVARTPGATSSPSATRPTAAKVCGRSRIWRRRVSLNVLFDYLVSGRTVRHVNLSAAAFASDRHGAQNVADTNVSYIPARNRRRTREPERKRYIGSTKKAA